jgi:hypothetical protein
MVVFSSSRLSIVYLYFEANEAKNRPRIKFKTFGYIRLIWILYNLFQSVSIEESWLELCLSCLVFAFKFSLQSVGNNTGINIPILFQCICKVNPVYDVKKI